MKLNLYKTAWSLSIATMCLSALPVQANTPEASFSAVSQTTKKTITGTVVAANNEPVIGAVVVVTGTSNGTVTDAQGNFKYNIPASAPSITVTSIGYKDQLVKISGKTNFHITMEE